MSRVRVGRGRTWSWGIALVLCAGGASARTADPPAAAVVDLDGHAVDPLRAAGRAPTVLVFTRTDCPVSNRYAPELRRLHDRFGGRGASFWLVYTDPDEPVDAIRRHRRAFGLAFAALRDPRHELVRLAGATVTPEAAVFLPGAAGPRMVYRGRIDDRAVSPGRTRAAPTRRDLFDVLEAVTRGETPAPRTTTAVGCFISALP